MIVSVQYARSGVLYLPKKDVVKRVAFRVKSNEVGYIKFYRNVSDSYFPIICKWENSKINECVETT